MLRASRLDILFSNKNNSTKTNIVKHSKLKKNLFVKNREVWPENDAFGAQDADAEDEFMALREILFATIPRPRYLITDDHEEVFLR